MKILKGLKKKLKILSFNKFVSIVTTLCFIISTIFAQTIYASNPTSLSITTNFNYNSKNIIPFNLGRITDSFYANSGDVVINIQDLHSHEQTQRNISSILSILDSKYGLDKVYVEGASGQLNTSWLANIQDSQTKEKVLNNLLSSGRLTGGEYFSIKSNKTTILHGLEDSIVYSKNFTRLNNIYNKEKEIQNYISVLTNILNKKSEQYYSQENKKINKIVKNYRDGKIRTGKYIELLLQEASKAKVNLSKYKSIIAFAQIVSKQQSFDSKKVNNEIKELLIELKEIVPFKEYKALVEKSTKKELEVEFYFDLLKKAKDSDLLAQKKYKNTNAFFEYLILNQKLNPIELANNEKLFIQELTNKFSGTENERNILFLQNYLESLANYLTNKMTAKEYESFITNLEKFKLLWAKYIDIDNVTDITKYIDLVEDFYKDNIERNRIFVSNLLGKMPNNPKDGFRIKSNINHQDKVIEEIGKGKKIHVVITGGFHTCGFDKLLEDQNINYIVITPNVTEDSKVADKLYKNMFNEQYQITKATFANRPITEIVMLLNKGEIREIAPVGNGVEIKYVSGETISLNNINQSILPSLDILSPIQSDMVSQAVLDIQDLLKTLRENANTVSIEAISKLKDLESLVESIDNADVKEQLIAQITTIKEDNPTISLDNVGKMMLPSTRKILNAFFGFIKNKNAKNRIMSVGSAILENTFLFPLIIFAPEKFALLHYNKKDRNYIKETLYDLEQLYSIKSQLQSLQDLASTAKDNVNYQTQLNNLYEQLISINKNLRDLDINELDAVIEEKEDILNKCGYTTIYEGTKSMFHAGVAVIAAVMFLVIVGIGGSIELSNSLSEVWISITENFNNLIFASIGAFAIGFYGSHISHNLKIDSKISKAEKSLRTSLYDLIDYLPNDISYENVEDLAGIDFSFNINGKEEYIELSIILADILNLFDTDFLRQDFIKTVSRDPEPLTYKEIIKGIIARGENIDDNKYAENINSIIDAYSGLQQKDIVSIVKNIDNSLTVLKKVIKANNIEKKTNLTYEEKEILKLYITLNNYKKNIKKFKEKYWKLSIADSRKNQQTKETNKYEVNISGKKYFVQATSLSQAFNSVIHRISGGNRLEMYKIKEQLGYNTFRDNVDRELAKQTFKTKKARKEAEDAMLEDFYRRFITQVGKQETKKQEATTKYSQKTDKTFNKRAPKTGEYSFKITVPGINDKENLSEFQEVYARSPRQAIRELIATMCIATDNGILKDGSYEGISFSKDNIDAIEKKLSEKYADSQLSEIIENVRANSAPALNDNVVKQDSQAKKAGETLYRVVVPNLNDRAGLESYQYVYTKDMKAAIEKAVLAIIKAKERNEIRGGYYNYRAINSSNKKLILESIYSNNKDLSKIVKKQNEYTEKAFQLLQPISAILDKQYQYDFRIHNIFVQTLEDTSRMLEKDIRTEEEITNLLKQLEDILNGKIDTEFLKERSIKFGTAGARGTINTINKEGIDDTIDFYTAIIIAQGMSDFINSEKDLPNTIFLQADSRYFGQLFNLAMSRVFQANNIQVYMVDNDLGTVPTPTGSFFLKDLKENNAAEKYGLKQGTFMAASINVTASHNPGKYNGFKINMCDGAQFPSDMTKKVSSKISEIQRGKNSIKLSNKEEIQYISTSETTSNLFGKEISVKLNAIEKAHTEYLIKTFENALGTTDASKLYLVINGNNSVLVPMQKALCEYYGIEYEIFNDGRDTSFDAKKPEPSEENMQVLIDKLSKTQIKGKTVFGIASDPDGDRFCVVDSDSTFITPNQIGLIVLNEQLSNVKSQIENNQNLNTAKDFINYMGVVLKSHVTSSEIDVLAKIYSNEIYEIAKKRLNKTELDTLDKEIAQRSGFFRVENLPVGWKNIADRQKAIESKGENFIVGIESSGGLSLGVYDKDGALATMLPVLIAAKKGTSLQTLLSKIHSSVEFESLFKETSVTFEKDEEKQAFLNWINEIFNKDENSQITELQSLLKDFGIEVDTTKPVVWQNEGLKLPIKDKNYDKYGISTSWISFRASGTEPKVRVYAETTDTKVLEKYSDIGKQIVISKGTTVQTRTADVILSDIKAYIANNPKSIKDLMSAKDSQERIEALAKEIKLGTQDSLHYDFTRNNLDLTLLNLFKELFETSSIRAKLSESKFILDRQEIKQILSKKDNLRIKSLIDISDKIRTGSVNGKDISKIRIVVDSSMIQQELIVNSLSEYRDSTTPSIEFITTDQITALDSDSSVLYLVQTDLSAEQTKSLQQKTDDALIFDSKELKIKDLFNSNNSSSIIPLILPALCSIGYDNFMGFLDGSISIDNNTLTESKYEDNVAIMMTLLNIISSKYLGIDTNIILPYNNCLYELPKYIQDLMKNDGVFFGQPGTNGQHSFYQELHQGTFTPFMTFIAFGLSSQSVERYAGNMVTSQLKLNSNVFAQADAFAFGLTKEEVIENLKKEGKTKEEIDILLEHKIFEGNRPSNVLTFSKLTPATLGSIVSLFENMQQILSLPEIKDIQGIEVKKEFEESEFTNNEQYKKLEATKNDAIGKTTQTKVVSTVESNNVSLTSNISANLISLLKDLFVKMEVKQKVQNMFNGVKINWTEKRAVLHSALRNVEYINGVFSPKSSIYVDGADVMPNVAKTLNKMKDFSDKVISGKWKGVTDKEITDIVSIGIGGSDLGPKMVTNTLSEYKVEGAPNLHFVSNVDPNDINSTLTEMGLNPETTLFIIESKTFTTDETISNAKLAKEWIVSNLGTSPEVIKKHFVAVSTNKEEVSKFGIDTDNMFEFWDWVGGRYSVWSAVGLPVMCSIGAENFAKFLAGGSIADTDLKNAIANDELEKNLSMIMAMTDIYNINILGQTDRAIQSTGLKLFVDHIQQLYMESLGKKVNGKNKRIPYHTGAKILESNGTNISDKVIEDTISAKQDLGEKYKEGMFSYNINLSELNPMTLGTLLALYENMVAIEGAVWDINAFDQWGVELGKKLAKAIYSAFVDRIKDIKAAIKENLSTSKMINYVVKTRKQSEINVSNLNKPISQLTNSDRDTQLKKDIQIMLNAGFKEEYIEKLLSQYLELRNGNVPQDIYSKTEPIKFGTAGVRGIMGEEVDFLDMVIITQAISNVISAIAAKQNIAPEDVKILVGGDSRFLSKQFAEIISKTLAANNINVVISSDDIPSPTISYYTRENGFTLSINITASHNPKEHNGYKITLGDGGQAGLDVTTMIESEINKIQQKLSSSVDAENIIFLNKNSNKIESIDVKSKFIDAFIKMITKVFSMDNNEKLNSFKQKASEWTVVVDPKNGATKKYYYEILKFFGFNIVMMNDTVDPTFGGQKPEPSFENTKQLREKVSGMTENKLLGISTDVDGDRFAVVDKDGNFITANDIGTILLNFRLKTMFDKLISDLQDAQDNKAKQNEILTKFLSKKIIVPRNCATTHVLDDLATYLVDKYYKQLETLKIDESLLTQFKNIVNVKEVNVGFKYFAQAKHEAENKGDMFLLGVESSGGISIAEWIYDKCGFLANLMLLFVLVENDMQPNQILSDDVYSNIGYQPEGIETAIKFREIVVNEGQLSTPEAISKEAKSRQENLMSVLSTLKQNANVESIKNLFTDIDKDLVIKEIRTNDGVKIVFENGTWLLIRPSGTEPIVRIFDETRGDKELSDKIIGFLTDKGGQTLINRIENILNNVEATKLQVSLESFKILLLNAVETLQRLTYSFLFKDNMEYTIVAKSDDLSRIKKAQILAQAGIKVNLVLVGNTDLVKETDARISTANGELAFCLVDNSNKNLTVYGYNDSYGKDVSNITVINKQSALIAMLEYINDGCDKSIKILDMPTEIDTDITTTDVEDAAQDLFTNIGVGKTITKIFADTLKNKLKKTDDMFIKPSLVASNISAEEIDSYGVEEINSLKEQAVTTIIISVNDTLIQDKSETLKNILQMAHDNGLKVMLNYTFNLEQLGVDNFVKWMVNFNNTVNQFKENGGIDGLQLDLSANGELANTVAVLLPVTKLAEIISEQNVGSFLSVKMPSNINPAEYVQFFKKGNIKLVVNYNSQFVTKGIAELSSENVIINISGDENGIITISKLSDIFENNKVSMISFDSSILESIDTTEGFSFAEMSITKLITSIFETTPDGQIIKGINKGRQFVANRDSALINDSLINGLYEMYKNGNITAEQINSILETEFKENISKYELKGFVQGVLEAMELKNANATDISFDKNEYTNLLLQALFDYRINEGISFNKDISENIETVLIEDNFREEFKPKIKEIYNILNGTFENKTDTVINILSSLKDNPDLNSKERTMVLDGLLLFLLGYARLDVIDMGGLTTEESIENIKAILRAA